MKHVVKKTFATAAIALTGMGAYLVWEYDQSYNRWINSNALGRVRDEAIENKQVSFAGQRMSVRQDLRNGGYNAFKNLRTIFSVDFAEDGKVCAVSYDLDDPSGKVYKDQGCQRLQSYAELDQWQMAQESCRVISVAEEKQVALAGAGAFKAAFCAPHGAFLKPPTNIFPFQ